MTTPKPTPTRPATATYTVSRGDTAWAIARRYKVTLGALEDLNGIRLDHLQVGQEITVPAADKVPAPAPVLDTPPMPAKLDIKAGKVAIKGLRFLKRSKTIGLTVHASASKPSQNWTAADVDRMHRAQGWLCIGYHYVICRDGVIESGRPHDTVGSHCRDGQRNDTHLSVCLIGGISENPLKHRPGWPWNGSDSETNFTPAQMASLRVFIDHFGLPVEGHRDVPGVKKACPSFSVKHWDKTGELIN